MKPSEIIYKKVPKFTNEHYLYLYELILRDLVEESQKKKKIERRDIFIVKCQSKKRNNYWLNISKAVTENDTHYSTISQKVSVLMVDYLRLKIKNNIVPKIITLSNQIGRSIDYVIRIHMHINRYEIANKNERKSIHSPLKLPDFENEYEDNKKKSSIVNLFIGNFDLKKFLEHGQKIRMRKTEFCNTFIFANENKVKKKKGDSIQGRKLFSPIKKKYTDSGSSFSQPKIYGKKGEMYIYGFNSMNFSTYQPHKTSIHKKSSSSTFTTNDIKKHYYSPANTIYHKKDLFNIEEENSKVKSEDVIDNSNKHFNNGYYHKKSITQSNLSTKRNESQEHFYFPKIDRMKRGEIKIKKVNMSSQGMKMENFLTKKDLYY